MGNMDFNKSRLIAYSGLVTLTRKDLEKLKARNRKAKISMLGILIVSKDVTAELANQTIESVKVHGMIRASSAVKAVLRQK
ncbi:hypothetical protein JZO70_22095 [Enterococcus sp. 669A]|uniref:Uncharacterized protein n=1 Tax=Candidatus Enterococcus moelleringii TaxID=2815325 RepID=A0ABS3LGV3_9ENTE|nr:hypothetical protein [Enterococcus sp. 669A]MBO1308879.1 hypothetical protein [Enterococcus sp. 669A]